MSYTLTRGGSIQVLLTPFYAILGACVGSFLNVCLFRWAKGISIVSPSSHCILCRHPLRWFDNIPLISFLVLKGKCRDCRNPISLQYPLVEFLTALLFWLSAYFFSDRVFMVASFFFVSFLILLVVSDLKWQLLPHPFNNLFILCGFFFSFFFNIWPSSPFHMASRVIALGTFVVGLSQLFPRGLGGGDIKMIAAVGAWMGVSKTFFVLIFAFGVGSLVAVRLMLANLATRKSLMPFGPFLACGSLLVWFFPHVLNHCIQNLNHLAQVVYGAIF